MIGALMNHPWLFCPSDNLEHRLALPTRSSASVRACYTYIGCVIQEGVKSIEMCAHRGASARRERHTLSLG